MYEIEIQPKDCSRCKLEDGKWTMVEAAQHFRRMHSQYLNVLLDAVALAQASSMGMEPWNG